MDYLNEEPATNHEQRFNQLITVATYAYYNPEFRPATSLTSDVTNGAVLYTVAPSMPSSTSATPPPPSPSSSTSYNDDVKDDIIIDPVVVEPIPVHITSEQTYASVDASTQTDARLCAVVNVYI